MRMGNGGRNVEGSDVRLEVIGDHKKSSARSLGGLGVADREGTSVMEGERASWRHGARRR